MTTEEQLIRRCNSALASARACLLDGAPYFSSTVYGLVPRIIPGLLKREGVGCGVTKGMVLYVDPEWFLSIGEGAAEKATDQRRIADAKRAGLLAHESSHILRDIDRLEALPDKERANIAADMAINYDLRKAGFDLPDGGAFPETFGLPNELSLEQYYKLLEQKSKQIQKLRDEGKIGPCSGMCGGVGGNVGNPSLERLLDAEVGRTGADVQRLRTETVRAIKSAQSMGRGTVPGTLKELLDEEPTKSLVPWRVSLSIVLRRATGRIVSGVTDYSMRRPSKRSYTRGIIRPGMIDRKVNIGIIQDSSGSMGTEQLLSSRGETIGIFRQLGIDEAWYLDVDARVASEPKRIRLRDIANLPVEGRGGTDFRPGIEKMLELRPRPDICVYHTDGDGTAPERAPRGMEVVWCIVPTPNGRRPADWGTLIVVSDDQELREPYQ